MKKFKKSSTGFTLIELLIVIAIIAVVASVIFVALDPVTRFKEARDAQRWQDVEAVGDAIRLYQVDNLGQVPAGVDENWKMLGTDVVGCDISCGGVGETSGSYIHDDQTDFNAGSYANTEWDIGNDWIELASGYSGTYTSDVIDAGVSSTWSILSWTPERPIYKALTGNSESSYSAGNVSMSNSVLLYHFDESSGTIVDSSGNGNNATNSGATYGSSGIFNTAMDFDGVNDRLFVNGGDTADFTDDFTISFWIYVDDQMGDFTIKNIIDNFTGGNPGAGYLVYYSKSNSRLIFSVRRNNPTLYDEEEQGDQKTVFAVIEEKKWMHITTVFAGDKMSLYIDGELASNLDLPDDYPLYQYGSELVFGGAQSLVPLQDRYCFKGKLDEVVFWERVLSPTEINDLYKRGALGLNFQVRSCDDVVCSGESFIGPDGTGSSYYSEINNISVDLPSFNLANVVDNQYFQYQASLITDNISYSPEFNSVTIETAVIGEKGTVLQNACLDLSSDLVKKLPVIPQDPSTGSLEQTFYALQKNEAGQINVQACSAEGEVIKISR